MQRNRLIPFHFLPASWGLEGQARHEAEAAYYYEGEALEHRLVDIRHPYDEKARRLGHLFVDHRWGHIDTYEHDREVMEIEGLDQDPRNILRLDLGHGRITEYDHDVALAKIDFPNEPDQTLALLEIERAYEKIDQRAYEKAVATAKREPWIGIVRDNFDAAQGVNGLFIEFDWNDLWIEHLRFAGYTGVSEGEMVEAWFADVSRQAMREQDDTPAWAHGTILNPS